ncbi:blastoderm-specific protein 25D isoform X2 [Hermetia illucens]|uniref:blastoderm-specific protein 25D isoform X2 n=1 Tax=Hermetia illucens TaxID=343691 RepID=UPI0018CC7B85|nr:blastoderm-specific protein 25D isoform X2 [Hermetia illucens]
MEISSDPYEQKLYHMFKSYDTDAAGTLDETALLKLCKSLELHDQGNGLINALISEKVSRVSFKDFKEALLNFLGTEMEPRQEKTLVFHEEEYLHGAPDSPGREISPKLVMGTKKYGRRSRPQSLVSDSSLTDSDTETIAVVPNMNSKVQRSSSQSEIHGIARRRPTSGSKLKRCASLPAQKRRTREQMQKQQESIAKNQLASSVESLDFENLSHTLFEIWTKYCNELGTDLLNRNELATVCERVGLNKVADKVAEEVFEKLNFGPNEKISFDEFIGLIQSDADGGIGGGGSGGSNNFTTTPGPTIDRHFTIMDSTAIILRGDLCNRKDSTPTADKDLHANKEMPSKTMPTCDIIDLWEAAGIIQPKKLMSSLGFEEEIVSISLLSNALEEELRTCPNESEMLLKASLVLHKTEVVTLKQAFRQLMEENKQIRTDNRDVNKRAAILAQEIDERHAALESTTRNEIRMLEQRHAEVIRELTSQLANDRENWSNLNARLESRIKQLESDEIKYKLDIQNLQTENSALETEQIALQKQVTELLEANIKLNNEIVDLEDRHRNDDGDKGDREKEEVLDLIEKITSLQTENANLRDKNDELVAEIEGLTLEMSRYKNKKSSSRTNLELSSDNLSDDAEHSSLAVKRRGDSPSKTRITEESPRLGKLRKCSNDNSENEASGDWVALNSELGSTISSSTIGATSSGFSQDMSSETDTKEDEILNLKDKISQLEKELSDLKVSKISTNSAGKGTPKSDDQADYQTRCQDLENSLEQMQKAYEECEDYWQSKLGEERALFEKERQIYEEEQQESDKKFAELMDKVREYEEQFSKDGRLSPIDERDNLEQQYADLEAEADELRENAKKIFEEKTKEISKLQEQILKLQAKLGDNIEVSEHRVKLEPSELGSPASSPICYLWNQSTIQAPARDYQNPNWNSKPKKESRLDNLTTSETAIFSTVDANGEPSDKFIPRVSPIQKPNTPNRLQRDGDETASNASVRSFESRSIASTHSVHKSSIGDLSACPSPNGMREELKRLKMIEIQLKEQIKDLSLRRDGLVMELQQLHEAKPVLEKAYARTVHPSLLQRINNLEQRNRHLQTILRQQQQYSESLMHQAWQQQSSEIVDLKHKLETQNMIIAEHVQRLANADLLVKDLYVENSHLAASIQRLEQQRSRANLLHQHHQGLSGVPGLP